MKTQIKKTINFINKLVGINNDRFEYYPGASERMNELNLKQPRQQGISFTASRW